MIGAIVQGVGLEEESFNPLIYHKFNERSVLDIVVDSCLLAPHLQKIVVSLPLSERKNMHGVVIGHKSKLNTARREALGRIPQMSYYDPVENVLDGLYQAALHNNLDHIVRIHANCPMLPAWLINATIKKYFTMNSVQVLTSSEEFNPGFRVDVFPFWLLAEAYIYQENRNQLEFDRWQTIQLKKDESSHIPKVEGSLVFQNLSQVEALGSIIENVEAGHDIADVLEETYGGH